MSDDEGSNIIEFGKKVSEEKAPEGIETRIMKCIEKGSDCKCTYCLYKQGAAEMVLEFLASDIMTHEKNNKTSFCTYDLKEVLFETILKVKELEKGISESKKD